MSLAVHVTATFFGNVVEETLAAQGRSVVLGGTDAMALPLPEGMPFLARLTWRGPDVIAVEDGQGRQHLLDRDGMVRLEQGPIALELRLVRQFRLRRLSDLTTMLSTVSGIALLAIVIGGPSLSASQTVVAKQVWCATWLGEVAPPESFPYGASLIGRCFDPPSGAPGIPGNTGSDDRWAEYLERILKKDLDGEDEGMLAKGDRQFGEKERGKNEIYMPAGDQGPKTAMGGAEEKDLRPVRTPPVPKEKAKPIKKRRPVERLLNNEVGTEVELPGIDPIDEGQDALADVDEPVEAKDITPEDLKEDREGWGVRDWYDQEDAAQDQMETDTMKAVAKRILRIDPDDPQALQVLAYYQYLSEDHEGALKTYDRFIELYPESAGGYNNKALIYKRQKKYDTEENLYRIALTLEPGDVTAMNNLAVNLAHQKRFDEALELMRQLEMLDPGDPYADLHRAKIMAEMGDDEQALVFLERALEGMKQLDTLHHIEFRQDIRVDPSFDALRKTSRFRSILWRYYGDDTPVPEE